MKIQKNITIQINGVPQFIAIRAKKEGLPLLLYLHGGPGDAALPLILKYNAALAEHFTLVIWEQRGAGKSYYPFGADDKITIDLYLRDTCELVKYLLNKYQKEKLYLWGHSWGSVLGLLFCSQYPALVQCYIGCGQVVNMKKSCQAAYDFALKNASSRQAAQLKNIDCTYSGENWLQDLLYVTKLVIKNKGSLYGARSYAKLVLATIFSGVYSAKDLLHRQKGALQGILSLWQELMLVNFEGITSFEVPLVFVEGRYDYHVSSQLVKEYFDTLSGKKELIWFEKSCHFPQWSEPERFHRLMMHLPGINVLNPR